MNTRLLVTCGSILMALSPIATASLPESDPIRVQVENGVTFRSGGVGLDERELLSQSARDFNVKLVFAENTGRHGYVCDVHVVIEGPTGERIVDTMSEGPWFFAKLGPGEYRVRTRFAGGVQEQRIVVTGGQRQVVFLW